MKNKLLTRKRVMQLLSLFSFLLLFFTTAKAQFIGTVPTRNGGIGASEYGNHAVGNNAWSDGNRTFYMTWDNTNLYIAVDNNGNATTDEFVLYIDTDPQAIVNGGTNANGCTGGIGNFDGNNYGVLPFRANFNAHIRNDYHQHRSSNNDNTWATNTDNSASITKTTTGNVQEFSIAWSLMGGTPAAFNIFFYLNGFSPYGGLSNYGATTDGTTNLNLTGRQYFNIASTADTASTLPFSRLSYVNPDGANTLTSYGTAFYNVTANSSNTTTIGADLGITNLLQINTGSTLVATGARTITFSGASSTLGLQCDGTLNPNNGVGNDINIVASSGTTTISGSAANTAYRIFNLTVNSGATVQAPSSGTVDLGCQFGTITVSGTLNFVNGSGVVNLTNNGATASAVTLNVTSTGAATFNNLTANGFTGSGITLANVAGNGAARLSFNNLTNNLNNTIIPSSGGTASTAVPITIRANLTNSGTITTLSNTNSRNLAITVTGDTSILNSSTDISYRDLTIANTGSTASNAIGVTVTGSHTMTNITTRTVTIKSGARLIVDPAVSITLAAGGTLQVNGFFRRGISTITGFGTATVFFNSGGTYEHNFTTSAGTIPTATWNVASTCAIIGYTTFGQVPTGMGQSFGNFTWNCTSGTAGNTNLVGALTTVTGDFSVLSTGASTLIYTNNNGVLTIGRDLIISGSATSIFSLNNSTGANTATVTVGRDFAMSGSGVFSLHNGSGGTGTTNLSISGNFSQSGGQIQKGGGPANIHFIKPGLNSVQTFSQTAGTMGNAYVINVGNGTTTNTLQLLTNVNLGAQGFTFNVLNNASVDFQTYQLTGTNATNIFSTAAGASLISADVTTTGTFRGSTVTNGSVATAGTSKTYNAGTNYTFNGVAAQFTGAAVISAANLTLNNTAGVTLSASTNITDILTVPSNNTLNLGTFTLTVSAASNNSVAGIIAGTGTSALVKTGAGVLTLSAASGNNTANTYAGGTTITAASSGSINVTGLANINSTVIARDTQSVTFSSVTPTNGTYRLLPGALTVTTQMFSHNANDTKIVTFSYANSTITVTSPATGSYRSKANGDWTALGTWQIFNGSAWIEPNVSEGYPCQNASPTRVDIVNSHSVTCGIGITGANRPQRIEVTAGANNTSLTFTSSNYFQMFGNAPLVLTSTGAGNALIDFGNASFYSYQQLLMTNSSTGTCKVIIKNGTVDFANDNITLSGIASQNIIQFDGSGILKCGGALTGGTISAGTGTVIFNANAAQSVGAYTFNNLTLSNNNTTTNATYIKTLNAGTVINGNLTISGSTGPTTVATTIARLPTGSNYTIPSLVFDTTGQLAATYGSSQSGASSTVKNNTYLDNVTLSSAGIITVPSNLPFVKPNVSKYTYTGLPQGSAPTNSGTGTSYTYVYTGDVGTTYGPTSDAPTAVGNYFVTVTVAANSPWAVNSSQATRYSIVARALIITANDSTKQFGATHPTGAAASPSVYTAATLQNGETIGSITIGSAGAANTAPVGTYDIVPSLATGGTFNPTNYSISYVNGTLTVSNPNTGDYRSVASTNWSTLTTWQRWNGSAWATPTIAVTEGWPGQYAVASRVYISDNTTVTADVSIFNTNRPTRLEFTPDANSAVLNINSGVSLGINGNVVIAAPGLGANTGDAILNVGSGSLAIQGLLRLNDTQGSNNDCELRIGTGSVSVSGTDARMLGAVDENLIVFDGAGTLSTLGGTTFALAGNGTFTAGTGTVIFNGATQTVGPYAFNNVILSGSGTKTINGLTTITGNLRIVAPVIASLNTGTTFNINTLTLDCGGTVSGTWGSSSSLPSVTNERNDYFAATTGRLNVATDSSVNLVAPVLTITQPTCNAPEGSITVTVQNNTDRYSFDNGATYQNDNVKSGLLKGSYNVIISRVLGCTSTTTVATLVLGTKTWKGGAVGSATSWNTASNWSPSGVPDATDCITVEPVTNNLVIDGTNFTASMYALKVDSGGSVTVNSTNTLKVENSITVNGTGTVTFENNASLVQVNSNFTNTGTILYKRATPTLAAKDYTYWSSPVVGQTLTGISPVNYPMPGSYFYTFNNSTDEWSAPLQGGTMVPGVGYIMRGQGAVIEANFTGVPNNGPIIVNSVSNSNSFLLGNPYPSAIDADLFLAANAANIEGTLYFWTHRTPVEDKIYTANDYASYNSTGGVRAASGGTLPTGKIAAGQGFFATSRAAGPVTFTNSMRVDGLGLPFNNSNFFKTKNNTKSNAFEKHRVWLDLTNSQGAFKQLLVGYITNATNKYDSAYDGKSFDGNEFVDFYSINQDKKLAIQGRGLPFDEDDAVPLGYRSKISGEFSINISKVDGLLANQDIVIEDKLTNLFTNLKNGSFTFTTAAGTFNDRFVLRYKDKTLGTNDLLAQSNKVLISIKNKQIKVNSFAENIDKVSVYDFLGRQIYKKEKVGANEVILSNFVSSHQTLIVKTTLQNGKTVSEKIIY